MTIFIRVECAAGLWQKFCDPETFQVILVNTPDDFKNIYIRRIIAGAFTKQDITKATGKEL